MAANNSCISRVIRLMFAITLYCVMYEPVSVTAQNTAKVTLDESGNIVFSATMDYSFQRPPEFDDPWALPEIPNSKYQWMYYDIRNIKYNNNYSVSGPPLNLVSLFQANPRDPALYNNSAFLQDLYYMGEYTFGDNYYSGILPPGIPDIETRGNNTYYAGKHQQSIGPLNNGPLTMQVVLSFDESISSSDFVAINYILKDSVGNIITTDHSVHTKEYGDNVGSWSGAPPQCGSTIEDCGFITGDYEYIAFIESHPEALSPNVKLISAYQNDIPYVKFTIIDEDTSLAPSVTIVKNTTYVGEADINTGASFMIEDGAAVDFIVGNGHGITFNGGFHAKLGSSFVTELLGGTSLGKQSSVAEAPVADDPGIRPSSQDASISVYPNPFSTVVNVHMIMPDDSEVTIELYDVQGRRLDTATIALPFNSPVELPLHDLFHMSRLSAGTYILRTETRNIIKSATIMKIR